ncbi:MAG: dihydrodipicolinate synthase family protein [Thermoproteota archaeon]
MLGLYPEGIVTAIITSLKGDMEIDEEGITALIKFLLDKGIKSFFVLGTYGEGILISKDERKKVLEKIVEVVPDKTNIIAHVGAPDAKTALELAKHAANLGLSAVSSFGPIYHKPDRVGLISYYNYISKAEVPIIIYNNKLRQGYNISPSDFEVISKEIPSVVGIKDTSYDVEQLQNYVNMFGKSYYVAGAGDSLVAITFTIGAKAHVCGIANAFPEIPIAIYAAIKEGKIKKAIELQSVINNLRKEFSRFGVETQVVLREVLRLRGINTGESPIPLRKLSEKEKFEVEKIFRPYIEYAESLR